MPLELVKTEKARKKVLDAIRATEMHIALSCIAMGILQILSLRITGEVKSCQRRFQRTLSKGRLSEGALMHYFRKHFFRLILLLKLLLPNLVNFHLYPISHAI